MERKRSLDLKRVEMRGAFIAGNCNVITLENIFDYTGQWHNVSLFLDLAENFPSEFELVIIKPEPGYAPGSIEQIREEFRRVPAQRDFALKLKS